ncbi:MAG: DNA translocase FtsK [Clostridia bacterium]|nr:DNA translocase FtsK [Clostridia bacterium]
MPFKGEQLAQCLTAFGLPCEFKELKTAPRITTYYFDFLNITKVTLAKQNEALQRLSMYAKKEFNYTKSNISHFAIYHAENNNAIVHLSTIDIPEHDTNQFVAGITEENEQLNISLDKMIHGLIAGTTGSGKSVFIKDLLYTLCVSNSPEKVQVAIIDKKRTLNFFGRIGHCLKVGNTDTEAVYILKRFQDEMYRRYTELQKLGIEKNNGQFPKWVLVIDELADLMFTNLKSEIEKILVSLCQLGRAAGIHCILCTQSPRTAVISGLIQANTPTKMIFKTASIKESVLCLGHKGAEELLGNGDCLIKLPDQVNEIRVQTPFASDEEFKNAVGSDN